MDHWRVQNAVIGLGHVGLPLAVDFGLQRQVLSFCIDTARVAERPSDWCRTLEVGPQNLDAANQLFCSGNLIVLETFKILHVTVPAKANQARRSDLTPLISLVKASAAVGHVLKGGDVVICQSTVCSGATEPVCVPVLERVSGLQFKQNFLCGYSVERINPIHRLAPSLQGYDRSKRIGKERWLCLADLRLKCNTCHRVRSADALPLPF